MKRSTAADLTILIGILVVVLSTLYVSTVGLAVTVNWYSQYGYTLDEIARLQRGQVPGRVMMELWFILMMNAALYVGIVLIAVGVYVRLQSLAIPLPATVLAPPPPPPGVCSKCGTANPATSKYCNNCGSKL